MSCKLKKLKQLEL